MKLDLINEIKDGFAIHLAKEDALTDNLVRLCAQHWKNNFDIDNMHLGPVLDLAMKNTVSGRLWGGEKHSIKSGLILLANHNPDLFWEGIKDLFNEEKMLIMKASRFIHHCDVILADIKRVKIKLNTHHQNYNSACLLLTLQYPSAYCLFDFEKFEAFCKTIEVLDVPVETDIERYYKILRLVYKIIAKDDAFMELYYSKLNEDIYFGPSLSLINDLMDFAFKNKKGTV